ncbi:MAG: choice-of-anchor J domain-containing protein, partial [Muribaculaceae bacterium]|nr:choice-of-anchor J domain-containing protein [Muribaculaceae bacterium]
MKRSLISGACALLSAVVLMAGVPERHSSTMKDIRTQPVKRLAVMAQAAGEAYGVPYECTLGKGTTDEYTVVDANGDGRTWKPGGFTAYSVCMAPNDESVDAADDWMITPAIALENGKSYLVTFDAAMTLSKTEDIIEVFGGLEATAEGMTERISPVIKYPCNDKAFTTYTYTFSPKETGNYFIGFHCMSRRTDSGTPKVANLKIEETATPVVVPDHAQEIPFESPLGSKDPLMEYYTFIDADGDGRSWNPKLSSGVSCMKPNTDDVQRNDDWLITVPLHLFAGKKYTFSAMESSALSGSIGETSAMYIGTAPTVEAMTTVLVPTHDITVRDTPVEADFTVDADGYYYIGVHCTSDKATSGIYKLSNLAVKEFSEKIEPAAAGTLTYEIAPKGELKATLTYTAPTVDVTGAPLQYLSKVVITTNWAYKTEINDVVPGGTYIVETTDLWDGNQNRFEAVAYIDDVPGEPLLITGIFAGEDTPLDPTNLKITLSDDYTKVILSWDPVGEVGEHGGWVNVDNLQYFIFDAFGSYYDPAIGSTTGTTYTIDFGDIKTQDFAAYQVTACVGEYNASPGVTSDIVVVGKP